MRFSQSLLQHTTECSLSRKPNNANHTNTASNRSLVSFNEYTDQKIYKT